MYPNQQFREHCIQHLFDQQLVVDLLTEGLRSQIQHLVCRLADLVLVGKVQPYDSSFGFVWEPVVDELKSDWKSDSASGLARCFSIDQFTPRNRNAVRSQHLFTLPFIQGDRL